MNQRAPLLVCALLAALSSLAICDKCFEDQFVDWSVLSEDLSDEASRDSFEELPEGLPEDLLSEDSYSDSSEDSWEDSPQDSPQGWQEDPPEDYIKTLRETELALEEIQLEGQYNKERIRYEIELARQLTFSTHAFKVYTDLIGLSSPKQRLEPSELFRVLQISLLLREFPYEENLCQFLIDYGRDKFGKHSMEIGVQFTKPSQGQIRAELQLGRFFAALMGLESEDRTDGSMLRAARSFDLTREGLKVAEALKVAEQSVISSENFFNYLLPLCYELRAGRRTAFNLIAFADAFGFAGRKDSENLQKLKEYNRLCLSLLRPDKRWTVASNIKRALENAETGS